MPSKTTGDKKVTFRKAPGEYWYLSRETKQNLFVVNSAADHWKGWEHARWLTPPDKPGSMKLFEIPLGDRNGHHTYARHLTAEVEVEDPTSGILVRKWIVKAGRSQNHFLDASYMSDVAASMKGVRVLRPTSRTAVTKKRTLAQMAKG